MSEEELDLLMEKASVNEILPGEMLLHVFSFLSTRELSLYVLPVCREWFELGNNPRLWLDINFKEYDRRKIQAYKVVMMKASRMHSFKCLHTNAEFITEVVCKSPGIGTLTQLVIPRTLRLTLSSMKTLVNACPSLTYLDMSLVKLGHTQRKALFQILHWKGLKVLKLNSCSWVNSAFISKLYLNCKKLEVISLDCNLLSCEVLCKLIEGLQHTLRQLSIKCESFTPELNAALHKCSQLSELNIKVLLGPMDMQQDHLCSHMSKLAKLSVFCCTERMNSPVIYAFGATSFPNLTEVYIYEASGSDLLAVDLAHNLPAVQTIFLEEWTNLTDFGVVALTSTCCHLRHLFLMSCNQVTGCQVFSEEMEQRICRREAPPLEVLSLYDCASVSHANVKHLLTSGKVKTLLLNEDSY